MQHTTKKYKPAESKLIVNFISTRHDVLTENSAALKVFSKYVSTRFSIYEAYLSFFSLKKNASKYQEQKFRSIGI